MSSAKGPGLTARPGDQTTDWRVIHVPGLGKTVDPIGALNARRLGVMHPYAEQILKAAHQAADVLDEWDGEASSSLGGLSPGGVVRHSVHRAAGVEIETCPVCNA